MTQNLFNDPELNKIKLRENAYLLKSFALSIDQSLLQNIYDVSECSKFRHMIIPGGKRMSVAMTNCGIGGWVSSSRGYKYDHLDSLTHKPWPDMPLVFKNFATMAAEQAGFEHFSPNSCLINRYAPGSRLSLHQDKDEGDFSQPIVSVSLGLPAKFLFGGLARKDKPLRILLEHGDVCVWGGASRLAYHGIDTLKDGMHEHTGAYRYNLTFRSVETIDNLK